MENNENRQITSQPTWNHARHCSWQPEIMGQVWGWKPKVWTILDDPYNAKWVV